MEEEKIWGFKMEHQNEWWERTFFNALPSAKSKKERVYAHPVLSGRNGILSAPFYVRDITRIPMLNTTPTFVRHEVSPTIQTQTPGGCSTHMILPSEGPRGDPRG